LLGVGRGRAVAKWSSDVESRELDGARRISLSRPASWAAHGNTKSLRGSVANLQVVLRRRTWMRDGQRRRYANTKNNLCDLCDLRGSVVNLQSWCADERGCAPDSAAHCKYVLRRRTWMRDGQRRALQTPKKISAISVSSAARWWTFKSCCADERGCAPASAAHCE
jgi:hypothetical protein